ncbi:XrtB/PEP-CTERM-associated transcriptional regulator EpsA [Rhodocyclus tenuis]|uniref:Transcriptional regulator EpsA n=1 Tax=Rhodocyclus tenuis TaxID=1066 RepID=A0A840GE27_RHOTE|nr:XrtB/PEP-CTERM-associated transcriptional regulator EpsA [Rhodocyclus tenuis]MBB4249100.1 transcriptional regulator EpsA [Rhodocyclus tenuis]
MSLNPPSIVDESECQLRVMAAASGIRRHVDLLQWLQGDLQNFVPHDIMVAAWGDFQRGLTHFDIASPISEVRTAQAHAETLSPLLQRLFAHWSESGKLPCILELGASAFVADAATVNCAVGGALKRMRSSLVHGIKDERGRHDCLYVMFSATTTHQDSHRKAMSLFLPSIDAALRQVSHLPHQQDRRCWPAVIGAREGSINPIGTLATVIDNAANEDDKLLSPREQEIMEWVRKGKTNYEVGLILDISAFTVKNHLQRIYKKLGVFNRTQASTFAGKQAGNARK